MTLKKNSLVKCADVNLLVE